MAAGVTIVDPSATWIEPDVSVGAGHRSASRRLPAGAHDHRRAAASSSPASASSTACSDDDVFVNSFCVITESQVEVRGANRSVRAHPPAVGRGGGCARRQLRRAEEDRAGARIEGQSSGLSGRRDDRREGQHRRRHDHVQLRRRREEPDDHRGRRVHRQRQPARGARSRVGKERTSRRARRSPRTCLPARSRSPAARRSTRKAGCRASAESTRTAVRRTAARAPKRIRTHVRHHRLHRPQQVLPILIDGLRRLEYRGYDSAGVAVVRDGAIELRRSAGKLSKLEDVIADAAARGRLRHRPHALGDARPARPRRTPIPIATAPAASSSSTTGSSRTTST